MVAWGCGGREGLGRGGITKGHRETFGGDKYIHYLDCGDGFKGAYICQN